MGQAIGDLLPSAVGVALSPIPIIAVILILATPKARSNGPAFALGWVLGLIVVSVIVLLVAGGADDPDSNASDYGPRGQGGHRGRVPAPGGQAVEGSARSPVRKRRCRSSCRRSTSSPRASRSCSAPRCRAPTRRTWR